VLYDYDLKAEIIQIPARIDTRYDRIAADTPEKHADLSSLYPGNVLKQRFARGEECFVAYASDMVVAYGWTSYREVEIGEINKLMHVKPDEVYLYDFYTRPEYRGNNLYPAVLSHILRFLAEGGFRLALIFVLIENLTSRRGVTKAGFRQFQIVSCITLFGCRFYIDRARFFTKTR
jgi:ribosomal protein S18 acetylase RimI-like enzyme